MMAITLYVSAILLVITWALGLLLFNAGGVVHLLVPLAYTAVLSSFAFYAKPQSRENLNKE